MASSSIDDRALCSCGHQYGDHDDDGCASCECEAFEPGEGRPS